MAKIGAHAVVLGASMAGLLAARSLSEFFDAVTVVERDPLPDILPDQGAVRRGVPQGRHLHGLLPRGAQVLEELFPGILDELVLDGAHYLDGRDLSRLHYKRAGTGWCAPAAPPRLPRISRPGPSSRNTSARDYAPCPTSRCSTSTTSWS